MKFPPSFLALLLLLHLQFPAHSAALTEAVPGTIQWARVSAGCLAANVVACGDRSYLFGPLPSQLASSCGQPTPHQEEVRLYPGTPADYLPPGFPCSDRACLSDIPASGSWVAQIDWDNGHGLTVAETLNRVSGLPVHLFALDAPTRLPMLGDSVGDAHVLMQLCAIAELSKSAEPPVVVNLSFGRFWAKSSWATTTPSLEGEIRDLIANLSTQTHFVAAAGNDGQMLFPAVIPEVLSVGALDLAAFRRGGVSPSRISPENSEALFPGYGLLLEEGTSAFPLAPGTSYASALASGWIAALVPEDRDLIFEANGELLAPTWGEGEQLYALLLGSQKLESSANRAASRLIEIAARPATDAWAKLKVLGGPGISQQILEEVDGLPETTWTEVLGQDNSPAPDSYPCVPCADAPDPWGGGGGLQTNALVLDLGAAQGFGQEGIVLQGLYLQSGDRVLRLTDSVNPWVLQNIAQGDVRQLELQNLPEYLHEHELLLVWVLALGHDSSNWQSFVRKTPITRVPGL